MFSNRSINSSALRRIKEKQGRISQSMEALFQMMEYTVDITQPLDFPDTELVFRYNRYDQFQDTNNLSLVMFLHYRDIHIVIPGDLERGGWEQLLRDGSFQEQLRLVNIFVASHHGRESGYHQKIFNFCNPEIILISDEAKKYNTQNVNYQQHARGIAWGNGQTRRVLSTRNDGMIIIRQDQTKGAIVSTSAI